MNGYRFIDAGKTGKLLLVCVVIIANLIILSPMLKSGFYSDDFVYHLGDKGAMKLNNDSSWDMIAKDIKFNFNERGRIEIFNSSATRAVLLLFDEPEGYKVYLVAMVLISLLVFYQFLSMLLKNRWQAFMMTGSIPLFFQMRTLYHDPLLAFGGLMMFFMISFTAVLIFLLLYIEHRNIICLIASVLFYLVTLLTYEIAYPMILIILFVVVWKTGNFKRSLKLIAPYVCPALVLSLIMLFNKSGIAEGSQYGGLRIEIEFFKILKAFIYQLSGVIPFSSRSINGNSHVFYGTLVLALVLALGIVLSILAAWRSERSSENRVALIALGLLFWITPALLMAIAVKYQRELSWGISYLPVYSQYFGFILVCGGMFIILYDAIGRVIYKKIFIVSSVAILLAIGSIHYAMNVKNIERANEYFLKEEIGALESAIEAGLFDEVPEDSRLFLSNPTYSADRGIHWKNYLYDKTGKHIDVYCRDNYESFMRGFFSDHGKKNNYILKIVSAVSGGKREQGVMLGQIRSGTSEDNLVIGIMHYFSYPLRPYHLEAFVVNGSGINNKKLFHGTAGRIMTTGQPLLWKNITLVY